MRRAAWAMVLMCAAWPVLAVEPVPGKRAGAGPIAHRHGGAGQRVPMWSGVRVLFAQGFLPHLKLRQPLVDRGQRGAVA